MKRTLESLFGLLFSRIKSNPAKQSDMNYKLNIVLLFA